MAVVVVVVVDSGAWDQQPSLEGDPGGPRGAPRGGDPLQDHLQPDPTRPNKTLPDPTKPIPLIQCYQVTFTGACYKLYGSFKTF